MLGIYIHIPFCVKKCNYCDFVSGENIAEMGSGYISALKKEMHLVSGLYRDQAADSVFIGGGTPGLLPAVEMAGIMRELQNNFNITNDAEITVETNPCVVTSEKLDEYRNSGINRISIGLQAAQDHLLSFLGRQHTVEQFDQAFAAAWSAGFRNRNIDVIYAIPGQTMKDWQETLYHALYLRPEHISAYALKIEPGTPLGMMLADGKIEPVDEDTDADMYEFAQDVLTEKGYTNYEISNFAFAGKECRHNMKYWALRDYLGLGAAAHSCIGNLRMENTNDVAKYMKELQSGSQQHAASKLIPEKERKFEYIMLKLRMKKGFEESEYWNLFREDFHEAFKDELHWAREFELLEENEGRIMPSKKGMALQNALIQILTQNM